jgi:hypothetical protein
VLLTTKNAKNTKKQDEFILGILPTGALPATQQAQLPLPNINEQDERDV